MVSTIDHVATAYGVDLLRRGGSAADAAVGANAVLAVVAPHLCGMGGDLWALVHHQTGAPVALDASGRAGSGADADRVRAEGHEFIPLRGHIASVTVPGAVDGWLALHERFGRLPLADVVSEAVRLAEEGFTASPLLAAAAPRVDRVEGNTDIPADLRAGDRVTRPGSARALRAVVADGRDGFYGGEFGEGLVAVGAGEYTTDDLAGSQARWVEPLVVDAWGHRIWTVPPTSQGYLTLAAAWIADGLELPDDIEDPAWPHLLVEAASQAGHDRVAVLYDGADGDALVAADRLAPRRAAIEMGRAGNVAPPSGLGDTTYLCAVDRDRMGVSLINSNASGFGSHLVAGTTGIFLQDRGIGFSLVPGHPAEYRAGRRPPHTLAPALVTDPGGGLRTVVGTMGGDAQPQIVLQLLARHLRHGQSAGRTIGSGRWVLGPDDGEGGFDTWRPGMARRVIVEGHAPDTWAPALESMGHAVTVERENPGQFGHAHLIEVTASGDLAGCADPRAVVGIAAGL
jgi:gamma-glutamyltranspeptidase/glutathione hydrolase